MLAGPTMVTTRVSIVGLMVMSMALAGCGGDDEPEFNRIGRIDGPATVNDDGGAELDGAPGDP
ncbi:MAG: hypothetical protein AAGG08_12120 [Actinomycetota bacterium]